MHGRPHKKRPEKQLESDCFYSASSQNGNLVIKVTINKVAVDALLDTGAATSLITKKLADKLKLKLLEGKEIILTYGDGKREVSEHRVREHVIFEGRSELTELFVVKNDCPYNLILGLDWCKLLNIHMDFKSNKIEINPSRIKYSLKEDTVIPSRSAKILTVCTNNQSDDITILEPSKFNERKYNLVIIGGISKFENGEAPIMVVNYSDTPRNLPKNLTIAERMSEEEIMCYDNNQTQDVKMKDLDINPMLSDAQKTAVENVILKYKDTFGTLGTKRLTHTKYKITLNPNTDPISQRPYRVPIALEPQVEAEINEMLSNNIIRPSESPWASPINLIKKKDGGYRFVVGMFYNQISNYP